MLNRLPFALLLATASLAAGAEGTRFMPMFTDPDFEFRPTLAAVVGALKPESNPSGLYLGTEVSFNSGVFQTEARRVRSHLTFGHYDQSGLKLTTIDFSPRYTVPMGSGFSIGGGPGIAYLRSTVASRTASHLAWMVAGGVSFRKGGYYAGVDLRYQDTREKLVGTSPRDADNWGLATKIGYNF